MKIEKCPFCGCKAILCSTGNHFAAEKFFVSCGVCGVETPRIARTRKEAIAAWNHRAEPVNKPLTLDELRQMDGEPVYYAWDDIGWSKVVVIDGHPRIAATINHGRGYECALYTPTDIEGNSYAYRSKPGEKV